MTDATADNIKTASEHLEAAARALGMDSLSAPDDRSTAVRVHAARPGVPLQMAYATVQVLRQMGWGPHHESAGPDAADAGEPVDWQARAEAAEGKLAAIRELCEEAGTLTGGRVLAIIGSEEES